MRAAQAERLGARRRRSLRPVMRGHRRLAAGEDDAVSPLHLGAVDGDVGLVHEVGARSAWVG